MEPIIVAMVGRSGSSLVSGIIHRHGVWVGKQPAANHLNPKGFFENNELKAALREHAGGKHFDTIAEGKDGLRSIFERIIRSQGYNDEKWLFKCGSTFHKMFFEFTPTWIKVWREPKFILKSIRNAHFQANMSDWELERMIAIHHRAMYDLPGYDIHPHKLIEGDDSEIKAIIEGIGLEYDSSITEKFIDRSYWHYG